MTLSQTIALFAADFAGPGAMGTAAYKAKMRADGDDDATNWNREKRNEPLFGGPGCDCVLRKRSREAVAKH